MIKYDRLAHLTTRASVVIEALKKATSGLIEVCEESQRVRRSKEKPLPDETPERALEIKNRTVYCKGFPRNDMDFDRIFEFFSQYRTVEDFQVIKCQVNHLTEKYMPNKLFQFFHEDALFRKQAWTPCFQRIRDCHFQDSRTS